MPGVRRTNFDGRRGVFELMKNKDRINLIENMKVLKFKKGGTVILKIRDNLPYNILQNLHEIIETALDLKEKEIKILILMDGVDVGILREVK
jgi:hypothetical protein